MLDFLIEVKEFSQDSLKIYAIYKQNPGEVYLEHTMSAFVSDVPIFPIGQRVIASLPASTPTKPEPRERLV